jgi:hypothetical protein
MTVGHLPESSLLASLCVIAIHTLIDQNLFNLCATGELVDSKKEPNLPAQPVKSAMISKSTAMHILWVQCAISCRLFLVGK